VKNGETLIRLQEQIRASRGLPVSGGSQIEESIEIIKLCCQVFFQVVGRRRRSWWGKGRGEKSEAPIRASETEASQETTCRGRPQVDKSI
jgi:hypothetical protein